MGCRNPFRMGIDAKTGYLYWGDVGPDSGADVAERGPMGYDEINQAKRPGNFGWPYFRGNDKVYYDYDFATKKHKGLFDINNPSNGAIITSGNPVNNQCAVTLESTSIINGFGLNIS